MSKIKASVVVLLMLILCFSLIFYFSDVPILSLSSSKKSKCAALAIRDNVIPFQKFGSRLFSISYLDKVYAETVYLTEYSSDEKHVEFVDALQNLLKKHEQVDIYLLAHANSYYRWVEEVDSTLRKKIRMVYNTGCSGCEQQRVWLSLGAQSYIGHRSNESISPVFYFYFLRRWAAGANISDCVKDANENMLQKMSRLGIKLPQNVLNESCAELFGNGNYSVR